jgi:predicted ATP-dependent serine protease
MKPIELSQEANIGVDVALSVLQCAANSFLPSNIDENQLAGDVNLDSTSSSSSGQAAASSSSSGSASQPMLTAKDFVAKSHVEKPIITFCESLDSMLGGGVYIGQITEFCGE